MGFRGWELGIEGLRCIDMFEWFDWFVYGLRNVGVLGIVILGEVWELHCTDLLRWDWYNIMGERGWVWRERILRKRRGEERRKRRGVMRRREEDTETELILAWWGNSRVSERERE